MSTITKEWLESQISAIKAVGITDSNTLQAFEIALASLEAEPAIHRWRRVTFEPYGPYPWHYGNFIGFSKPVDGIEDEYYYAAPPAPVSVPAAMEMDDDFDSAFEHGKAVGWNAYRAAMLQGAEPVSQPCTLREGVAAIRNSGIAIDDEKIKAERDALNEPTCWCHTFRPVTVTDMRFIVCPDCGNKRCPHANDHRNACTGSNEPGQEGSAYPAAPQQEVTQALAKGMERYGDAMQKLADSGD